MTEFDKIDFIVRPVELPEGNFIQVDANAGGNVFRGLARSEAIAMAICLDKIAAAIRNRHHEKIRANY